MNWDRIDATVRSAYRKNGREMAQANGKTPLSDLIAKDPVPALDEMTELMLCDYAATHHVPIGEDLSRAELIDRIKEALETNWEERVRGMIAMLDYIFEDGPHPLCVYRRTTAVVKAIRPRLTLDMSCAQLAVLCNDGQGRTSDGRATVSARIKRVFEEPISKAGMRGCKASFQKTESAGEAYSAAARGNQNRLGSDFLETRVAQKNGHDQTKRKAA
jgi:hypothetical protein